MTVLDVAGPLLYSCNHAVKYDIQNTYRGGVHYVWVSEYFDSREHRATSIAARLPKSSNPAQIYAEMAAAVAPDFDDHDWRILDQRQKLWERALVWLTDGEITENNYQEIITLVNRDDPRIWRPYLYVIPRTADIERRLRTVPVTERAGTGRELCIADLRNEEFDIVKFDLPG